MRSGDSRSPEEVGWTIRKLNYLIVVILIIITLILLCYPPRPLSLHYIYMIIIIIHDTGAVALK